MSEDKSLLKVAKALSVTNKVTKKLIIPKDI
jgi:hypothetical protein